MNDIFTLLVTLGKDLKLISYLGISQCSISVQTVRLKLIELPLIKKYYPKCQLLMLVKRILNMKKIKDHELLTKPF